MIFHSITLLLLVILLGHCQSKQIYMQYVFRHGARYPLNNYYDGKQTAPFHGRLTAVGLRQQYLLGNYIAQQYSNQNKSFNSTLSPREVQFFAVFDSQRCIQSAYGHALGLFPFLKGEVINQNIDTSLLDPPFQTIFPSHLQSQSTQNSFALQKGFQPMPIRNGNVFFPKCQNQKNIFEKRGIAILDKVLAFQTQHLLFVQKMKSLFNLTEQQSNVGILAQLYDTLVSDNYLGRPLPSKLTTQDYEKLAFIQRYLFTLVYEQQPARIFNAPFVTSMIQNMENLIKGNLGVKKLSIHSAHDSNVVPLLTYFNLTTAECLKRQYKNQSIKGNCAVPIPFASNLFFELHQDDKNLSNYFVKARYNGIYYDLCGKGQQCNFKQFSQISLKHLLNFEKQCAKPKVETQILIDRKENINENDSNLNNQENKRNQSLINALKRLFKLE